MSEAASVNAPCVSKAAISVFNRSARIAAYIALRNLSSARPTAARGAIVPAGIVGACLVNQARSGARGVDSRPAYSMESVWVNFGIYI